jgi:hypothetical protein
MFIGRKHTHHKKIISYTRSTKETGLKLEKMNTAYMVISHHQNAGKNHYNTHEKNPLKLNGKLFISFFTPNPTKQASAQANIKLGFRISLIHIKVT